MAWPTHIVAAVGFVFDSEGNILLIKTPNRGWDCTGGQVENGESIEEGVIREIMEESGVKANVVSLCGIYSNVGTHLYYDGKTTVPTKVMMDFICEYESGELTTSNESLEVKWVPKQDVMKYVTTPAMKFRFEKALAYRGKVTYASYVTKPEFKVLTDRIV